MRQRSVRHIRQWTTRSATARLPRSSARPDRIPASCRRSSISNCAETAAPAGTPADIVNRLHAAIAAGLTSAEVKARFAKQGADIVASTPAEFAGFIKREIVKWTKVIKDAGATVD